MFSPLSDILYFDFPSRVGPEADRGLGSTWETLKGIGAQPRSRAHLRSHDKFLAKEAKPSFPKGGTGITLPCSHISPLAVMAVAGTWQDRVA